MGSTVLRGTTRTTRATRIMATSGPASATVDALAALIEAGADSFRLNLSAAGLDDHAARIERIVQAGDRAGRRAEILIDLQGRKVRLLGVPPAGLALAPGTTVELAPDGPSDAARLAVDQPALLAAARPGAPVLLQDGSVALEVLSTARTVTCRVIAGGTVRPRAGVALPEDDLDLPALCDDDLRALDVLDLSRVDAVALSYAGSAKDVTDLRAALVSRGATCRVVAKIERAQGMRHLGAIAAASDELLVARGDLGVELGLWRVPVAQKQITEAARTAGRPAILATHLLESMVRAPRPTRAEVNDVANAVWDGVATLCVTAETAVGAHPLEVVRVLDRVAREAEAHPAWRRPKGAKP